MQSNLFGSVTNFVIFITFFFNFVKILRNFAKNFVKLMNLYDLFSVHVIEHLENMLFLLCPNNYDIFLVFKNDTKIAIVARARSL